MGEAKRRQARVQPSSKANQMALWWQQFLKWTTRGTWVGIGLLVLIWVTVRFIGPSFGWWQLAGE
ncbi:MAG: DUF2839 domain-containing protein [Gloeomargarita sp. SKYG116]|nr:DUF2839 domain-containing protein [Gloeomargarita sp. SKYG116]MDW8401501.1 DUF2839 domain-containing protein [Gloeomargarita sp. SKYGB_i_bin116]